MPTVPRPSLVRSGPHRHVVSDCSARWTTSAPHDREANQVGRCICRCARRIRRGLRPHRTTHVIRCGRCRKTVRRNDVDAEGALHPWLAQHLASGRNASHADDMRHRILQASYYGLMSEVDDNMGRLFAHLKVDRGMERYARDLHIGSRRTDGRSLVVRQNGFFRPVVSHSDDRQAAQRHLEGAGGCVHRTRRRDADDAGMARCRSAAPMRRPQPADRSWSGSGAPRDWRTEAHWEYDFRDSQFQDALGVTLERVR